MFSILRGGCFSKHSSDFVLSRPNGLPYYVLLIVKTTSQLEINGNRQTCKPNSALLIRPNTPYSYHNPEGNYMDDWIHFSCDASDLKSLDANMFHNFFPITNTRLLTGYIQQMLWENNFCGTPSKEFYVDAIFRVLLQHLSDDFALKTKESYHPFQYKLQRIRLDIQSTPYAQHKAKDVADSLGISTSYFQSLYKLFFHIPFQSDVINMRIEYAKELITTTTMPLDEIANACGYSNEVHFYRQFLAKTGMTPGEYRNTYL